MKLVLVVFLTILGPSCAMAETYHRLGPSIIGSDGSRVYRMGGTTFVQKHDAFGILRTKACRPFGSSVVCR